MSVIETGWDLTPFLAQLENLAAEAIEPNPFYEPWMLEPAVRLFPDGHPRFVLVFAPPENAKASPLLAGFFPVELVSQYGNFPVRTLRLWQYKFCYLCVPLLRKGYEREALSAFLHWALTKPWHAKILALEEHTGDGPFQRLLVDLLPDTLGVHLVDARRSRPLLERAPSAQAYLDASISRRHQKDMEKKERKLAQTGELAYVDLGPDEQLDDWISAFLALEAAGWKGKSAVALAGSKRDSDYFEAALRGAHRCGKLSMLALKHGGNFVALRCSFLTAHSAFAFLITYDETFAPFSPGLLLEAENIRRVHRDHPEMLWMDSCADRRSPLFNRVWKDKRVIETVLLSTGSVAGDLWILSLPLLRWLRAGVRRASAPAGHAWTRLVRRLTGKPTEKPAPATPLRPIKPW